MTTIIGLLATLAIVCISIALPIAIILQDRKADRDGFPPKPLWGVWNEDPEL